MKDSFNWKHGITDAAGDALQAAMYASLGILTVLPLVALIKWLDDAFELSKWTIAILTLVWVFLALFVLSLVIKYLMWRKEKQLRDEYLTAAYGRRRKDTGITDIYS